MNKEIKVKGNEPNEDENKKIVQACLNCRKNHKKCDGNKPCSNCSLKKIDCVADNKRKSVGRPRKSEEEKKIRVKREERRCTSCKAIQTNKAKFWY